MSYDYAAHSLPVDLADAVCALNEIREQYLNNGSPRLRGSATLQHASELRQRDFVHDHPLIQMLSRTGTNLEAGALKICYQLELMCAAAKVPLPEGKQLEQIHTLLIEELALNVEQFGLNAEKLAAATILNQQSLWTISSEPEFAGFGDNTSVIHRALLARRSDPRAILRVGIQRYHDINSIIEETGQQIQEFTKIMYAFFYQTESVRNLINNGKVTEESIYSDPEFSTFFTNQKSIVRYVVKEYSADLIPVRLRQIRDFQREILSEDEFKCFWSRPSELLQVAAYHPNNPRDFLRTVQRNETVLKALFAEKRIPFKEGKLRVLCIKSPEKARLLIKEMQSSTSPSTLEQTPSHPLEG